MNVINLRDINIESSPRLSIFDDCLNRFPEFHVTDSIFYHCYLCYEGHFVQLRLSLDLKFNNK